MTTTSPTKKQLHHILDSAIHAAAEAADAAEVAATTSSVQDQERLDAIMIRTHNETTEAVRLAELARQTPGKLSHYVRRAVAHAQNAQILAGLEPTAAQLAAWLDQAEGRTTPTPADEQPKPAPTSNGGFLRWLRPLRWTAVLLAALLLLVRR
ncbi:hypothetical protein [Streptomyces hydrogenans]|uniref:hypothetical protein n=1 Tax=Streptomyces hydrogenans TaxID=1873719 RepID=UPI003813911D